MMDNEVKKFSITSIIGFINSLFNIALFYVGQRNEIVFRLLLLLSISSLVLNILGMCYTVDYKKKRTWPSNRRISSFYYLLTFLSCYLCSKIYY